MSKHPSLLVSDLLNPKTVLLEFFFSYRGTASCTGIKPATEGCMLTRIMKYISLLALIGAPFFWTPSGDYAVVLQFIICGSASLIAFEAGRSGKAVWAVAFTTLAILFNPLVAFTLPHSVLPWINALCSSMFLASLIFLKRTPRLSVLSITYTGPRSQAL